MANEGSTNPTYSELEAELLRVRGLLQRYRLKSEDAKVVRIDSIKDWRACEVRDWSTHHPLAKLTHDYYAEAFRNGWGESLAPITLYVTAKDEHELEDGFHRLSAAIATGQEYINAQFLEESGPKAETGRSTKWTASEPLDYDAHVVKGFIEVSAPNDFCFTALFPLRKDAEDYIAWKNSGSAETGGEKAALKLSKWGRPIVYIAESSWYSGVTTNQCVFSSREEAVRWAKDQGRGFLDWDTWAPRGKYPDCEFDSEQFDPTFFAKWDDGFVRVTKTEINEVYDWAANSPRSSQNQTAPSGVEGAHEGITADSALKKAQGALEYHGRDYADIAKEIRQLFKELGEAQDALRRYSKHDDFCAIYSGDGYVCDCGLAALLRGKVSKITIPTDRALAESSLSSPPRKCANCGMGNDTDGDGNCAVCKGKPLSPGDCQMASPELLPTQHNRPAPDKYLFTNLYPEDAHLRIDSEPDDKDK